MSNKHEADCCEGSGSGVQHLRFVVSQAVQKCLCAESLSTLAYRFGIPLIANQIHAVMLELAHDAATTQEV